MGLFDNIVLGLLDLVEGKNKKQDMTYDEALNILMDGTAPTAVLKDAFKCVCNSETNNARTELHFCLGMLCGVFKDRYGHSVFDSVFGFVMLHMLSDYSPEMINEDMKLMGEIFRRRPDFNREVNEFALNAQPDYKNYVCVAPYLSLAHLYGWGYEPDVQEAEAFADRVAETPKNSKETEWLRARIEAVKNGK